MNIKHSLALFTALMLLCTAAVGQEDDYPAVDEFTDNLRSGGKGPLMVIIPAGTLTLGEVRGVEGGSLVVRFENPIGVSAHEITAGQYRHFLTATKSGELRKFSIPDDNLPVYGIS